MRYLNCNLCSSNEYVVIGRHRKDRYCKPEIEVRTVICKICGLVYVNPQLGEAELHNLYSTTYAGIRLNLPGEGELLSNKLWYEDRLKWIEERVNIKDIPGKVLDVGCGPGSFLDVLRRRGWDAYGIEPTPHYAEFARERYRVKVTTGFLEDVQLPEAYFDMVTLERTFEHMADPTQALITIRNSLKEGGIICIDVPNILKPKKLPFFEAPHLYYFSPNTLSLLLRKIGFELIVAEDKYRKLGANIWVLARKGNVSSSIDFSREGDNYREIIRNVRWKCLRLAACKTKEALIRRIVSGIVHIFGGQRGRQILELIKSLMVWKRWSAKAQDKDR